MNFWIQGVLVFFLTALTGFSQTGLRTERIWKSPNGKSLRGAFSRLLEDRSKVEILGTDGRVHVIGIENLAAEDRLLVLGPGEPVPKPVGAAAAFKPEKFPERKLMGQACPPSVKLGGSLGDAVCLNILWWDRMGVIMIPRKSAFERKAKWACEELAERRPSNMPSRVMTERYFQEHLPDVATVRIMPQVPRNGSIEKLRSLVTGLNVVVFRCSPSFFAAVEQIDEQGKITMHAYGKIFTGTMIEPGPDVPRPEFPRIEIDNPEDYPSYFCERSGDVSVEFVFLAKPYIYAIPGKPSPPPPDPLFPD